MDFDFSPIVENWRFFAGGLGITVALSAVTAVSSICLLYTSPSPRDS